MVALLDLLLQVPAVVPAPAPVPVTVVSPWFSLANILIANMAAILGATATLVWVIKGGFKALEKQMDGHFTNLIEKATLRASTEAKVDTLLINSAAKENATKKDTATGAFLHQRKDDEKK